LIELIQDLPKEIGDGSGQKHLDKEEDKNAIENPAPGKVSQELV
jgi:hypothetical protein